MEHASPFAASKLLEQKGRLYLLERDTGFGKGLGDLVARCN